MRCDVSERTAYTWLCVYKRYKCVAWNLGKCAALVTRWEESKRKIEWEWDRETDAIRCEGDRRGRMKKSEKTKILALVQRVCTARFAVKTREMNANDDTLIHWKARTHTLTHVCIPGSSSSSGKITRINVELSRVVRISYNGRDWLNVVDNDDDESGVRLFCCTRGDPFSCCFYYCLTVLFCHRCRCRCIGLRCIVVVVVFVFFASFSS